MQELIKMQQQIEEIHTLVKTLARQRRQSEEKLTAEQVAERAKLSVNTIKACTQRGKIKSRQTQPGVKGSKRYYVASEVFGDDGELIVQS